jgi:MerR family transcriptional regulator, redox-sensitive transcriptional activator SoxR
MVMTIGELARRARIQASAVRYYESIGLLAPAARRAGRRIFEDDALERLAVITFAKQLGFSLNEVKELFGGFKVTRWKPLAVRKLAELEEMTSRIDTMRGLLRKALRCGCLDVEECGRAMLTKEC